MAAQTQMRVLLTGASGFCGQPLARALINAGYFVRAVGRRPPDISDANLEFTHRNLSEPINWAPLLDNVQAIVHLAAITAADGVPETEFDLVNHQATAILARAAATAGVLHFVFISSVSAQSGPSSDRPLCEADDPRPPNAYGRSKLAAENAVRASGVPFTILRPVMMYGDVPRGYLTALARLAATPFPLPFGAFNNRRSLLSLDNFVSAVLFALQTPTAKGETFLVADPKPISLPQILKAFRHGMGRRSLVFPFPAAPLRRLVGGRASELIVEPTKLMAAGWVPIATTEAFLAETVRSRAG